MRPMDQCDPTKPPLVPDKLNNKTFSWEPDRHGVDYEKHAHSFEPGVIEWDGLLLDGWEPIEDRDVIDRAYPRLRL